MNNSATGKLSITAELRIKDTTTLDAGLSAVQDFCDAMNSEVGCHMALAHQNSEDPRTITLWEIYQDQTAFDAHFSMPHTQAFIKSGVTELIKANQSQPVLSFNQETQI